MDQNTFIQAINEMRGRMPKTSRGPLYPIRQEEFERLLLEELFYYVQVDRRRAFEPGEYVRAALASVSHWGTSAGCKPGLLLSGPTGTGKTSAVKALQAVARRLKLQNHRIIIPDLFRAEEITYWATSQNREHVAQLARCSGKDPDIWGDPYRVLGIDDLGTESEHVKNYGNDITPVVEILARRCDMLLPTIITTNLGPDEIAGRYGDRTISRIYELFEVIPLDGPDHRTQ